MVFIKYNKKLLIISILLISLSLISLSSAQSDDELSEQCSDALNFVTGSPELGECFPPDIDVKDGQLTDEELKKIVPEFDSYCSQPKCSDTLLNDMSNILKANCSKELADNDTSIQYIVDLIAYNPILYDVACFKDNSSSNNSSDSNYCYLKLNHTIPKKKYYTNAEITPKQQLCTNCNKLIANAIVNFEKSHPEIKYQIINSTEVKTIEEKCEKTFFDGNNTQIVTTAINTASATISASVSTSKPTSSFAPSSTSAANSSFKPFSYNYSIIIGFILTFLVSHYY
ncbi:hypothetical protein Glove_441g86 [Diversispora epigaea]|uniref:Saposin B-type domain-containing protein n=1 Tax=Diversispora epigaea TaxID=1348612 RepID=A0A397GV42_9GLOM|nr:hypothetical protein Glove_441g86 [Diversispora epigaea]